jgi:hypothetical protein
MLRNILKHAGPGVLNRAVCHNEEELISLEPVSKIHPLSYFAFEEGGKIWAFDIKTLCKIIIQNQVPLNPYTRIPIPHEARKRIRFYFYNNWPTSYRLGEDVNETCLNLITQTLHENGFESFRSEYLQALSKKQTEVIKSFMLYDLRGFPQTLRLKGYCNLLNGKMGIHDPTSTIASLLLVILRRARYNPSEEYQICWMFMSALFRV